MATITFQELASSLHKKLSLEELCELTGRVSDLFDHEKPYVDYTIECMSNELGLDDHDIAELLNYHVDDYVFNAITVKHLKSTPNDLDNPKPQPKEDAMSNTTVDLYEQVKARHEMLTNHPNEALRLSYLEAQRACYAALAPLGLEPDAAESIEEEVMIYSLYVSALYSRNATLQDNNADGWDPADVECDLPAWSDLQC